MTEYKIHKVFGVKENVEYSDREGVYLNTQVGVVQTPKGYFFLGGGLGNGESHLDCIERERIEEALNGKMFVEMQNWALEQLFAKSTNSNLKRST